MAMKVYYSTHRSFWKRNIIIKYSLVSYLRQPFLVGSYSSAVYSQRIQKLTDRTIKKEGIIFVVVLKSNQSPRMCSNEAAQGQIEWKIQWKSTLANLLSSKNLFSYKSAPKFCHFILTRKLEFEIIFCQ